LGWSPRSLRRWRERYEAQGYAGLVAKRLLRPSIRCVPAGQVEQVLRLYRERYTVSAETFNRSAISSQSASTCMANWSVRRRSTASLIFA
jgi:hypothetical protein